MGWIGPRKNRRVVAGLAAGPMGPMGGRTLITRRFLEIFLGQL